MTFIIAGVVCCIVGVFMPWVSVSIVSNALNASGQSLTGFDLNEGLIGAAAGVIGGLLGGLGARAVIPPKLAGAVAAVGGLILLVVSAVVIFDSGTTSISNGQFRIAQQVTLMPGVFLSAIGGLLLLIGGVRVFLDD